MMKKTLRQNLRGLSKKDYEILRTLSHLSKNLYNETLYEVRQYFFDNGEYLNYYNAWNRLKNDSWNYDKMPSQVAQQTMKNADKAFQSFFKLVEKARGGKYDSDKANPPNYLDKDGFYMLDFTSQRFQVREDYIRIGVPKAFRNEFGYNKTKIKIPFTYEEVKNKDIKRLLILPKNDAEYFEYRLIYEDKKEPIETEEDTFLSIDLGVNNLATCVDQSGRSFIINGRKLKSMNRWYNKEIARLRGIKDKQRIDGTTKRISKLFKDRRNRIHDYLNKTVHKIIGYCKENEIGTVIVGDGKGWKQKVNMGDKNTQNFVEIPFDTLKQKLKHKCEYYEINFELVDESYTSKCSFLDDESVEHHEKYDGTRIERGLFKSSDGTLINADVNSALNIAKKAGILETISGLESSGVVATPQRIRSDIS